MINQLPLQIKLKNIMLTNFHLTSVKKKKKKSILQLNKKNFFLKEINTELKI